MRRLASDTRGSSAVEFALVSFPLILMLLMVLQIGMYYMAKSSLDAGVVKEADALINSFNSGVVPTIPSGAALKGAIIGYAPGGLVKTTTTIADLRLLTTLSLAVLPITDGQVDTSAPNISTAGSALSILVLRAQATVPVFTPFMGSLAIVRSTAIVRRQGF